MSDPKTNTEGGSFAETPKEESVPKSPKAPEEETVFTYLKEIIKAIEAKEAQLAHHLDRIASALEKMAKVEKTTTTIVSAPIPSPVPTTKPTPTPAPAPISAPIPASPVSSALETVKSAFPKDLADMLYFEDKGNMVTIKPRQYLGSENFAKIASISRSINGEYVSAGKESHFRVVSKK